MGSEDRITTFKDAAAWLYEEPAFEDEGMRQCLDKLGADEFGRLCVSFRKAEVLEGMLGYFRRFAVCGVSAALLLWAAPRISAHWLILLSIVGAALILASLCFDVISYVELERRCVRGLGMRVGDVIFEGSGARGVVREFSRSLRTRVP